MEEDKKKALLKIYKSAYENARKNYDAANVKFYADKLEGLQPGILESIKSSHFASSSFEDSSSFVQKYAESVRRATGRENEERAKSLFNMGDIRGAIRCYEKALEIERAETPTNHSVIAELLTDIGFCYHRMRVFEYALSYCEQAITSGNKIDTPDYAVLSRAYRFAGAACIEMKRTDKAKDYVAKALQLANKMSPPSCEHLSSIHCDSSVLCVDTGAYGDAIKHIEYALEIYTEPKNNRSAHYYIQLYSAAAVAYSFDRQYETALQFLKLAEGDANTFLDPCHNSLVFASIHSNLGHAYEAIHNYAEGLTHCLNEAKYRLSSLQSNALRIRLAHTYIRISMMCARLNKYGAWNKYLNKAKEDLAQFTANSYQCAEVRMRIGQSYYLKHDFESAIRWIEDALEVDPFFPPPLFYGCAVLFSRFRGKAFEYLLPVIDLVADEVSMARPDLTLQYGLFALRYLRDGDEKTASYWLTHAMPKLEMYGLSTMALYLGNLRHHRLLFERIIFSIAVSVVRTYPSSAKDEDFYANFLHVKDLDAEAAHIISTSELSCRYPDYENKLRELKDKQLYLDHLMGYDKAQSKTIKSLRQEIESLEIFLSKFIKEIDFKQHMSKMTAQNVLDNLPSDGVLLEYGWFFSFETDNAIRKGAEEGGCFYVYVLAEGRIELIFLNNEGTILENIEKLRKKIINKERLETGDELSILYRELVAPIETKIAGAKHLYIAPDGELFKVPFELLLNKYTISYLSSGRDLVRMEKLEKPILEYESIAIVADPKYDLAEVDFSTPKVMEHPDENQSRTWKRGVPFKPLPFGKIEAKVVREIFGGKKDIRDGLDAKKYTLKDLECGGSPNIVHIITHGFAYEAEQTKARQSYDIENPLVRSGLVFAGVNTWLKSDRKVLHEEYGDGILNAKEVLSLDLSDTDLLVLSACQTGLGDARNGEGIQGLRRSFELVGVKSIVCTLWEVDDVASAIFMEQFYQELLTSKADKHSALESAKMFVKTMTNKYFIEYYRKNAKEEDAATLENQCAEYGGYDTAPFQHPYYWAAYVVQGKIDSIYD